MATQVILPALGKAQESGIIVRWLKAEGEEVVKGEPLAEIETDKATVEIEAPASGILANMTGTTGVEIPVGEVIASIMAPGELSQVDTPAQWQSDYGDTYADGSVAPQAGAHWRGVTASPLAARIAAEHHLDLESIKPAGRRIQSTDVLAHIQEQQTAVSSTPGQERLVPASPKARKLAAEQGKDLAAMRGSGPGGAILAEDVLDAKVQPTSIPAVETAVDAGDVRKESGVSKIWRIMAERTTQSR